MMDCKDVKERLVEYGLGMLRAAERGEVSAHLESCGACRAAYEEFAAVRGMLSALPRVSPSADFTARVRERYRALRRRAPSERLRTVARSSSFGRYLAEWFLLQARRPAVLAAACMFVVGFLFFFVWKRPADYAAGIAEMEKLPREHALAALVVASAVDQPLRPGHGVREAILRDVARLEMQDVPEQPWRGEETVETGSLAEIPADDGRAVFRAPVHPAGEAVCMKRKGPRLFRRGAGRPGAYFPGGVRASFGNGVAADLIQGGLAWLARAQNRDGSWGGEGSRVYLTSLAGLCFLADGDMIRVLGYTETVARARAFLLAGRKGNGFLGGTDREGVRAHVAALVFLLEYAAAVKKDDARPWIAAGIRWLAGRSPRKGWETRTGVFSPDASLAGWYLQLAAAARRAGYALPSALTRRVGAWVTRVSCVREAPPQIPGRREDFMVKQAVAMAGRLLLGRSGGAVEAEDLVEFLAQRMDRPGGGDLDPYYLYFAALALYWEQGKEWYAFDLCMRHYLAASAERVTLPGGEKGLCWLSSYRRYAARGDVFYTALHVLALETALRYATWEG